MEDPARARLHRLESLAARLAPTKPDRTAVIGYTMIFGTITVFVMLTIQANPLLAAGLFLFGLAIALANLSRRVASLHNLFGVFLRAEIEQTRTELDRRPMTPQQAAEILKVDLPPAKRDKGSEET